MSPNGSRQPGQAGLKAKSGNRLFLGILVALSVITLGLAAWHWHQQRQLIAQQSGSTPPQSAALAPEFELMSLDGTPMSLTDLRGKVVLLNFWATWCAPCVSEMPELNALYRQYGDEKDFVVVGVNLREQPAEVASFARKRDIAFPLLLDRDGHVTSRDYRVRTLPASVIIDREGRIRDSWSGPLLREALLARLDRVW